MSGAAKNHPALTQSIRSLDRCELDPSAKYTVDGQIVYCEISTFQREYQFIDMARVRNALTRQRAYQAHKRRMLVMLQLYSERTATLYAVSLAPL